MCSDPGVAVGVQTAVPVGLDGTGPGTGPSSMQLFPSDFGPTPDDIRRRNAAIAAENAEIIRQKKAAEAAARAAEAYVTRLVGLHCVPPVVCRFFRSRDLEAYQDAMMTCTVSDWDDTNAGVDAARRLRDENKRLVRLGVCLSQSVAAWVRHARIGVRFAADICCRRWSAKAGRGRRKLQQLLQKLLKLPRCRRHRC
jgi:hypothetical protein